MSIQSTHNLAGLTVATNERITWQRRSSCISLLRLKGMLRDEKLRRDPESIEVSDLPGRISFLNPVLIFTRNE